MGRGGLVKWVRNATPSADELRGRWELKMLDRYTHQFLRRMMGTSYHVTPRQDTDPPKPFYTEGNEPPVVRRSSKDLKKSRIGVAEISWQILEGLDLEEIEEEKAST